MEIDDYLPCSHYGGLKPQLIFGKINDGKLCIALLEKAFAKLYGSYAALCAGHQPVAWHHFTGCKEFFRYKSSYTVAVRWVVTSRDAVPAFDDTQSMFCCSTNIAGWPFLLSGCDYVCLDPPPKKKKWFPFGFPFDTSKRQTAI